MHGSATATEEPEQAHAALQPADQQCVGVHVERVFLSTSEEHHCLETPLHLGRRREGCFPSPPLLLVLDRSANCLH